MSSKIMVVLAIILTAVLSFPASTLAGRTWVGRYTFLADGVPQYFEVDRYAGNSPYLHVIAHTQGSPWCAVDILEFDYREHFDYVRTNRQVPGDHGQIYHLVTGASYGTEIGNVGLVTWGGGAPAYFDVWVLTDSIPEETPWEDWWYSDPANPDQPSPGGILFDVGSDVEHPVTYVEGEVFTGRLNVRRYSCYSSAIKRVEFDMHFQSYVWFTDYSVISPFTGLEVTDMGGNVFHVSVWADEPVYIDPVYACEFEFDPPTWAEVTLSNCVFTNAMDSTYAGECFANLRANWRYSSSQTEPCTWGRIKGMYR